MANPPDFIEPSDLVQDIGRPESATWPESSTLPQRAVKLILDAGISYYGQTGQQFAIHRALPFLEKEELTTVETLVRDQPLKVVHGFARTIADFPALSIVLSSEAAAREELFLGDYATVGSDNYGDAGRDRADMHHVGFDTVLNLIVYSENPDVTIYWYELTKFILIQSRLILARLGIDIPTLSGSDLKPLPEFMPELVYMRQMKLRFRTRQVFAEAAGLVSHLDAFIREMFTRQNISLTQIGGAFIGKSETAPTAAIALTYAELLETSGAEGERETVLEGGTYAYSSTLSHWIREEAYLLITAIALIGELDGSTTPESEGFSEFELNNGAIRLVGNPNRVEFDSSTQADAVAYATVTTPTASAMLFETRLQVLSVGTVDSAMRCALEVTDTVKDLILNLCRDASGGGARIVDTSNNVLGTVHASVEFKTTERFVEVLLDPAGTCKVWFDNTADAALEVAYASLPAS